MHIGCVIDPDPPHSGRGIFNEFTINKFLKRQNVSGITIPELSPDESSFPAFWSFFPNSLDLCALFLIKKWRGKKIRERLHNAASDCERLFIPHHTLLWASPAEMEADVIPYVHDIAPTTSVFAQISTELLNRNCVMRLVECDTVICASKSTAQDLLQRTAYSGSLCVVYQGVDTPEMKPREVERDIDFLYVGALHERKDPDFLKKSLTIAQQEGFTCAAVNYEELSLPCQTYVDISPTELSRLYSRSRFLLHSSVLEGFGRTPVEAQLHGAIPLGRDIPINHEVLGSPNNAWEIISTPQDVIKTADGDVSTSMRECARQNASRFKWEQTREELAAIIFNNS